MDDERFEQIGAHLLALETIIALMVPIIWRDGTEGQRLFIENLRAQARDLRATNAPTAAIEAYERVARLADDDSRNLADLPPSGRRRRREP